MKTLRALFVVCALLLGAAQAQASVTYTQVDMQGVVNSDLTSWYMGHGYPQSGGPLTVGGINFQLATMPAYPGQANNPGWWKTAVLHAGGAGPYPLASNVANPTTAYVLLNSAFGYTGTSIGNLAFQTASGGSYTYELIEGVNVRDHYAANSAYTQTASSPDLIGTAYFYMDNVRLDAYAIALPAEFSASTLSGIILSGYGQGYGGSPFVAAVTVASSPSKTPIPGAVWLLGTGLAGLAGLRRKFKA